MLEKKDYIYKGSAYLSHKGSFYIMLMLMVIEISKLEFYSCNMYEMKLNRK